VSHNYSMGPKIILASSSPRRRELLKQAGIPYTIEPAEADESALPGEMPRSHVKRLALLKARTIAARHKNGLVLGADTVVVVDGEILGKPASKAEAKRMLTLISGRAHEVLTGIALVDAGTGRATSAAEKTKVFVKPLSEGEIDEYIATGEPMDKAGAYGIQGRFSVYVRGVRGCFFNVVGLPLPRLFELIKEYQ
jgi:nucleoside triphosphate pyrophosphatase